MMQLTNATLTVCAPAPLRGGAATQDLAPAKSLAGWGSPHAPGLAAPTLDPSPQGGGRRKNC